MSAAVVALTSTTRTVDGALRVRLNEAYVDATRAAGLVPLILPPVAPHEVDAVLAVVNGLVLTGGEDVDPAEYGAPAHPRAQAPHRRRDHCELAAIRRARALGLPTLGICRGIQTINVALGGTLVQDIPSERPSSVEHDQRAERDVRVHAVDVDPSSTLAHALQATRIEVNSYHHQAVDRVASGCRVSARAPDGIIEGMEWAADDWWMLAVQWHPEELVGDRQHDWDRELFRAFAEAVRREQYAESSTPRAVSREP